MRVGNLFKKHNRSNGRFIYDFMKKNLEFFCSLMCLIRIIVETPSSKSKIASYPLASMVHVGSDHKGRFLKKKSFSKFVNLRRHVVV